MQEKSWVSIDEMPLYNWIKCTEENDYRYVLKDINKGRGVDLHDAWYKVYDDYIKRFGLGDLYLRLLNVMKEKALLELEFVETREKFKLTEINIREAKLKSMMANRGEGISINTALVYMSKWLGYHLNTREVTVLEFFEIREQYGKENKKTRHKR